MTKLSEADDEEKLLGVFGEAERYLKRSFLWGMYALLIVLIVITLFAVAMPSNNTLGKWVAVSLGIAVIMGVILFYRVVIRWRGISGLKIWAVKPKYREKLLESAEQSENRQEIEQDSNEEDEGDEKGTYTGDSEVKEEDSVEDENTLDWPTVLASIDEFEFEKLIAALWKVQGWRTRVTANSGDRGIDVIATKKRPFRQKVLIQAKKYQEGNKVGSPEIQQYAGLKQQESDADQVVVVTTSSFTRQAQDIAQDLNVKLIDGIKLENMLKKHLGEPKSTDIDEL